MIGKHINLIKVKHQSKENQSTLNEDVVKMLSKISNSTTYQNYQQKSTY